MNTKNMLALCLTMGTSLLISHPSLAKDSCKPQNLEAARQLTHYGTYMSQMHIFAKSGGGTQQQSDAIKEAWLAGKKRGLAQLEKMIEDCEQQAKTAERSPDAARLLALSFEARLVWDIATPGSRRRDIYADAVAAISAIDHHEETGVLIPFLEGSALEEWREDPELGLHLMERAIDIAERVYGRNSIQRAEQLGNLAFLFAPSTKPENPHANAARAEALYEEAFAIYARHPEAMTSENYKGMVALTQTFYQEIGNTERARELADLYAALAERANTP